MTTSNDIIRWVEELKGGTLNHEEGVHHGSAETPVHGVTVCWKAVPAAIDAAGERGDDLIVGHESLYYPYYFDYDPDRTPGWPEWGINVRRKEQLERYGLTYLRLHTSIDYVCIAVDMGKWLELGEPTTTERGTVVWEIAGGVGQTAAGVGQTAGCTVRELADRAKRLSGLPAIRVSAPNGLDQTVRRAGLLVGGAGLCPNGGAFEPYVRAGCDVLIAGETDNYGFRYAAECGIPLVEISHEVVENPGFRHFAEMLAGAFPDLNVTFFENTCPYCLS
jgi:putative NIF3 family GTP cyclohydrolase 1 type 2